MWMADNDEGNYWKQCIKFSWLEIARGFRKGREKEGRKETMGSSPDAQEYDMKLGQFLTNMYTAFVG